MSLIELRPQGIYVPIADVYVDPWKSVPKALITHAHSDHARSGSKYYLCTRDGYEVTRSRLGPNANLNAVDYGQEIAINGMRIRFYPAGHILGSAQIRFEFKGEVLVISGDYKTESDQTCLPIEPIRCHTFLSESTFAFPFYDWPSAEFVFSEILDWWKYNQSQGCESVLRCYSLGKAQRLLLGLHELISKWPELSWEKIRVHETIEVINEAYRKSNVKIPPLQNRNVPFLPGSLHLLPPGGEDHLQGSEIRTGFCSGWMQISANRKRGSIDRGFVLSDHADWKGLINVITETGAEKILLTHGKTEVISRYLTEKGIRAEEFKTRFGEDER
ncbi:DNA ligase-associated DEXH box helicase [Leptospira perolatii]|uniref:DNA ligase-associated DEXH box helicase n=1 Tax=Leptospira perolatii TaxID=2023191 RepID=A0A2M9ZS13_9LEPT|nr:ligase-associated DNA damage response exonuclease [Leptospira perolatii]PJZ71280.1 DNA ligase-associated DEXH box helicase [Leptospira perolatii]PJZ74814.1 DNA ligase-associated DEXH box helicase [Leptospira perolatii]